MPLTIFRDSYDDLPQLVTARLRLRPLRLDDSADVFAIFNDPAVTRHYDLSTFDDEEEAAELIDYIMDSYEAERQIRWGIVKQDEDRVIGTCGFVMLYQHRGEIGYDLAQAYWRQGIMREALGAVIDYGFETLLLNRIEAMVMPQNVASAALLRSLGFQQEGVLRQYDYFKDAHQDLVSFSLLRQEYYDPA